MTGTAVPIRRTIADIPTSAIRRIASIGMQMDDVIPLWFGEPDAPTPDFITEAGVRALREGRTRYTLNRGIPELRAALAAYMEDLYGKTVDVERVTVTASAMNAIALIMQCLIDPGDNAVMVGPLWPNIPACARIMGGEVREIALTPGEERWTLDLDRLFDATDERTRGVLVNSPSNPTGWVMSRDEQKAVLDFCRKRGIWVIADEVYDRIVYEGNFAPSFLEIAQPEDLVLRVNSFSKSWAMTGWRLGWITAPAAFGPVIEKMTEFNVANAPSVAQHAGIAALAEGESFIRDTVGRYRAARDLTYQRLGSMPRVRLSLPRGAFYAFFAVDGVTDSLAFAEDMLRRTRVGLAPGIAFGPRSEGYLRLCFASALDTLSEGFDRIEPLMA
ncbi:MAG: pyridoxal phosphate-dependent aminotransferase [Rhodospirillaceae bacterium]|nr:pyridoxal phosphate-dependent aminotransferase [Rhodospirillaceae bacterium]